MSRRRDRDRLEDVREAAQTITTYLQRGSFNDGIVYDAVRMRLLEIGEAVKAIDPELLAREPSVPWDKAARMRDRLAHRYFDTDHAVIQLVVYDHIPPLVEAVERLLRQFDERTASQRR